MVATFIIFILGIFVVLGFKLMNFVTRNTKNKTLIFINKFSNIILLFFSFLIIFVIYAINSFKDAFVTQNHWMIKISILSYLIIYSFIFSFFILILLFIPFRTIVAVKKYIDNKSLLKNNLKLFFIFGTIIIILCTLMYAFNNSIIKLDYNYGKITPFNDSMIVHYLNLSKVVNYTVKSEWVPWVLISYTLLWSLINYLVLTKKGHALNKKIIKNINNALSYIKYIIPIFCYISIVSTFILSWQSFFIRCAILLLVMVIFTFINYIFKLVFKEKSNDENNFFIAKDFVNNTIVSVLFMFYLTISSSKILSVLTTAQHVNLWFSMYISSFLISIIHVANPNQTTNRIFACVGTAYISSGVNTFALYFFAPIFDVFSHINSKAILNYVKFY